MATAETRTVTEEVTEYTLTLSEDEKVALLDLLAEDNNSRLEDVWYSLRFADAPEASTLKVGDRVRDKDGDVWEEQHDGSWNCLSYDFMDWQGWNYEQVRRVAGPLTEI